MAKVEIEEALELYLEPVEDDPMAEKQARMRC